VTDTDKPGEPPSPGDAAKHPVTATRTWRDHVRSKPGLSHVWRVTVFVAGLVLILGGFALAVLPGPLTIPPVLLGLWLWSTEFEWAHRFFHPFKKKGQQAWDHSKRHPYLDGTITVAGLVAAVVVIWAVSHYHLVDRGRDLVGL
jgi:hypothetical protein